MMRTLALALLAAVALPLAAQTPVAPLAADSGVAGVWLGSLGVGGMKLRLGATIRARPDGSLHGTLDSFDQGALGIPIDSVIASGDSLRLVLPRLGVQYRAVLAPDRRSLVGTWSQGAGTLPLVLARADSAARAAFARRNRPQEPKAPFPYRAEEVSFPSVPPAITIAGTLTLPEGPGPHPAVVLISGSGPQDRDEALLGHRPFLVLADHLTRRGIAVLRYDDRGTHRSTGNFAAATSEDFADDVRAAVAYLRARPDIAKGKVGLVGHSEGGLIAPMVARDTAAGVAFVVLLAGPGVPGEEILLAQSDLIGRANGVADSVRARNGAMSRRVFQLVRTVRDTVAMRAQVRAMMREYAQALPANDPLRAQFADSMALELQVRQLTSPWFRYFLGYDPRPALRALTVPVLAVNGTLDLQVPHEQNLSAIGAALTAGGNRDHTERAFPGLNHLFQTATTGAPGEYAEIEETIAPAVLQQIADWILARVRK